MGGGERKTEVLHAFCQGYTIQVSCFAVLNGTYILKQFIKGASAGHIFTLFKVVLIRTTTLMS